MVIWRWACATTIWVSQASAYETKAFQLREHASEREKLDIAATYYIDVTGELDKAAQTYQEEIEHYPRLAGTYQVLCTVYSLQGQYEKAAEITRQEVRLEGESFSNSSLVNYALALERFDEAQKMINEAQMGKAGDNLVVHAALYALAFLRADSVAMAEQQKWFAGNPDYENFGLALASDTEAYFGRLSKAQELTKRAVDSAIKADSKEGAGIWQAIAAQREAAYGNPSEARQSSAEALKRSSTSEGVESEAALAMAGDTARAESLRRDLEKRFPVDTQMQSLWLPAIRGQLALNHRDAATAINLLQPALPPTEYGQITFVANLSCLYPTYIRGEAYLAARQGKEAASGVSEDSRPQRYRLELLDGSVGASGNRSCEHVASESFAGRRCRRRPRPCARRLQGFLCALERR